MRAWEGGWATFKCAHVWCKHPFLVSMTFCRYLDYQNYGVWSLWQLIF